MLPLTNLLFPLGYIYLQLWPALDYLTGDMDRKNRLINSCRSPLRDCDISYKQPENVPNFGNTLRPTTKRLKRTTHKQILARLPLEASADVSPNLVSDFGEYILANQGPIIRNFVPKRQATIIMDAFVKCLWKTVPLVYRNPDISWNDEDLPITFLVKDVLARIKPSADGSVHLTCTTLTRKKPDPFKGYSDFEIKFIEYLPSDCRIIKEMILPDPNQRKKAGWITMCSYLVLHHEAVKYFREQVVREGNRQTIKKEEELNVFEQYMLELERLYLERLEFVPPSTFRSAVWIKKDNKLKVIQKSKYGHSFGYPSFQYTLLKSTNTVFA
jgi:hypothetical protein